jgi:hypothetical protein
MLLVRVGCGFVFVRLFLGREDSQVMMMTLWMLGSLGRLSEAVGTAVGTRSRTGTELDLCSVALFSMMWEIFCGALVMMLCDWILVDHFQSFCCTITDYRLWLTVESQISHRSRA